MQGIVKDRMLALRDLNRATLERQMLLRRWELSAAEAIEQLVGYAGPGPHRALRRSVDAAGGFSPEELACLITGRRAVRVALMRNTIHLVTARDCLALRPLVQPVFDRHLYANRNHRAAIEGVDIEALVAAGRALLEERPHTAKELGELLREWWPERDPTSLARVIRHLLPLVQVPPRGIWGKSGQAIHTTAEAWLGCPLDSDPSLDEMVLRYLGRSDQPPSRTCRPGQA